MGSAFLTQCCLQCICVVHVAAWPCARKHRSRALVIEAVQSVVIEAQQRNDTEKIWEAYDRGLHIESLAQDLVVVWTTLAWPRTA